MLAPPPTGLKRRATVPALTCSHHKRPPAQRVRSPASLSHPEQPSWTKPAVRLCAQPGHSKRAFISLKADAVTRRTPSYEGSSRCVGLAQGQMPGAPSPA